MGLRSWFWLPGVLFWLVLLLAAPVAVAVAVAAAPAVVVSVKPVHSLVAGVMEGVGEPALLVRGGASPHAYALRPSDARLLAGADLVVWVGPQLEQFLERPLKTLGKDAAVLTLADAAGMNLLATRAGGAWEGHHHGDEEHGDHEAGHEGEADAHDAEHGEAIDAHLWLDPENARAIVRAVAARLSRLDPDHRDAYAANAATLDARLVSLEEGLARELAPVSSVPFLVFHDAYHYFEHRFGLNGVGSVTVSPEAPPSARRVAEIRDRVRETGARCVFAEPQFTPALVNVVVEGTGARTGVLDPVGATLPEGPELYFSLLQGLGQSLTACLTAP